MDKHLEVLKVIKKCYFQGNDPMSIANAKAIYHAIKVIKADREKDKEIQEIKDKIQDQLDIVETQERDLKTTWVFFLCVISIIVTCTVTLFVRLVNMGWL